MSSSRGTQLPQCPAPAMPSSRSVQLPQSRCPATRSVPRAPVSVPASAAADHTRKAGGRRVMPPRRGTPGVATFTAASGILSVKRGCPR
eukprot:SAG25_NODE_2958_length_1297_cov_1.154424_2_plen_89_part_00